MDRKTAVPAYRRSIDLVSVWEPGERLRVTGRLHDTLPTGPDGVEDVHQMSLSLVVELPDLVVVEATADMDKFPHAECPLITNAVTGLVGMPVGKGFTRELNRRFGGPAGCSHLKEIARNIAPVVVQSMLSTGAPRRGEPDGVPAVHGLPIGSCHIWQENGVAVRKLQAGWVPGSVERPVLKLSHFTRNRQDL